MQIILYSAFYALKFSLVPRIGGNVGGRNQKLFAVEIESKAPLRKRKVSNFRGKETKSNLTVLMDITKRHKCVHSILLLSKNALEKVEKEENQ